MHTAKILGMVLGGLVALVVIALLAVWLLVNPNDFKPRIGAAVKNATGRELNLAGDIKLSVFPWIALELGPASLGNPPGFGEAPFVSFKHASVRAKLMPLLSKRLEIGRVELDGLDLKLVKNAEGKGNWEGFGHAKAPSAEEPQKAAQPGAGEPLPRIEGVKITNASVRYEKLSLSNFNFETGSIVDKSVVPVTLHVDADRGTAGEHASLDAHLNFRADSATEDFNIAALNLTCDVSRPGDARPLRFSLTVLELGLNLKAQTLSVPSFAANLAGAELSGSAMAKDIIDAVDVTGAVKLAPLLVREFLPRLGINLPQTRDPKAFSSVSASTDFAYGKSALHLEKLQATLDDTHLKGGLGVNLENDALHFELAVDTLDADRYLAPTESAPPPEKKESVAASKPMEANGTLTVGSLHFAPLDLTHVKVGLAIKDKVIHVHPLKAEVSGGEYSGDITLDNRAHTPALSLDEHLTGIDVGKLVATESKNMHVSGRGSVNIKATAHGDGADALLKSLNGHFDAAVNQGAVQGMDLGFALAQAVSLVKHQGLSNAPNTKETKFDALKLSAVITNGVAETHDLTISSAVFKVSGQGSLNLPQKTVDLSLLADTLQTAGGTPLRVPVKVTGPMTSPSVKPDIQGLIKGEVKQKVQEKVQEVLQDKLKGLFNR